MKWRITFSFLCFHLIVLSQYTTITFTPVFKQKPIQLNECLLYKKDSIRFETIRFYITDIRFYKQDKEISTSSLPAYLIDVGFKDSISFFLTDSSKPDSVLFTIGVDSLANSKGIGSGDMDPVNGMYWTWQSGYINIKIEGVSSVCNTRKNKFNLHLGGFLPPFLSAQELNLKLSDSNHLFVNYDLSPIIEAAFNNNKFDVMSPSEWSVKLSEIFAKSFYFSE